MDKPTKFILVFTYLISLQMFLASVILAALGGINYALTFMLISVTWMGMPTLFVLARRRQKELEERIAKLERLAEERDAAQPALVP